MSKQTPSPDCLAFIPHAIESHWDNVWAPRLAGFPVNIVYAASIEGVGLAQATYVFDPTTFVADEQSRQMRYRPEVDSGFSVLVKLHRDGGIHTFKYRGSELIREASGPDFRTAMIHITACGLALDEPIDHQDSAWQPAIKDTPHTAEYGFHWAAGPVGMCCRGKGSDLRPSAQYASKFLSLKAVIFW